MTGITRRRALIGAGAAAVVAGVPGSAMGEDAELVALGRQWLETYGEWIRPSCEDASGALLKRICVLQDRMADIPARSHNGTLVKLRVAAEHYRLMGDIDGDLYARLTYQAWQGLETERAAADFERLAGEARS